MTSLVVPDTHKTNARGNKCIGMFMIDPMDFLYLTVQGSVSEWIRKEQEAKRLASLEMYNEWSRQREILVMPHLDIDKDTGLVLGHEGRHRAAALLDRHVSKMPVAICLRVQGHKEYFEEPFIDEPNNPKRWYKRYLGKRDVPARLIGQFTHTTVKIDLSTWEGFYSEADTLLPVTAGLQRLRPVSDFRKVVA